MKGVRTMKYGKKILAYTEVELNYDICDVFCLDGGEYYDIHIVHDDFKDDDSNTLQLQEPKECCELPNKMFLTCRGIEFLLWNRFYGKDKKAHFFTCENHESIDL
jgi:hypothetical protein